MDPTDGGTTVALSAGALLVVALGGGALWLLGWAAMHPGRRPDDGSGAAERAESGGGTPGGGTPEFTRSASATEAPPIRTDEDRVLDLLAENGGRLKQTEITNRTEWSKSKVSRLLSKMADNDQITKVSVGRENIITLHGEEPKGARTPFEE